MSTSRQRGFTIVETLVGLAVFSTLVSAVAGLLLHNSRLQRGQLMAVEAQRNARTSLSMIAAVLRSAGWDPLNTGIDPVVLDDDPGDDEETLEVHADLNEDGDIDDDMEQVLIRHVEGRIEWRRSSDVSAPFEILADWITNDADGDGLGEAMFVPDSALAPSRITVRITARSSLADPRTRAPARHTLSSEIVLRDAL